MTKTKTVSGVVFAGIALFGFAALAKPGATLTNAADMKWTDVQMCFAGDTVLSVYIVADAYGIYHLIDDITVNGKTFSKASDNSNGDNTPAGPDATLDPSLLPPVLAGLLPH